MILNDFPNEGVVHADKPKKYTLPPDLHAFLYLPIFMRLACVRLIEKVDCCRPPPRYGPGTVHTIGQSTKNLSSDILSDLSFVV